MDHKIDELVEQLISKGDVLKPCSVVEIQKIEQHFNCSLPLAYKDFLLALGKGAKLFMVGSDCFFNDIFTLREGAEELLAENNFKPLPEEAFVFFMHQGYQFAFFLLDESHDPKVYYYYEGKTKEEFPKVNDTLSDFFIAHLGFMR